MLVSVDVGKMARKKSSTKSKSRSTAKKSSEKDSGSEYSDKLFKWLQDGYEVDALTELVKSGTKAEIKKAFSKYQKGVRKLKSLAKEFEQLDVDKDSKKYKEIESMLMDPENILEIEEFVNSMKYLPKMNELKAELASLNVTGFEKEAKAIIAKFGDITLLDEIDADIKLLKKRIKEKFFESAFEMELEPGDEAEKGVVTKGPLAETVFFLHRDGTLLSVKSRIPPEKLNKKLLSRMVMAIREQMNKAFKEQEHVHKLTYQGHSIILEDSNHVYAAVVIAGEEKPVMYKIILKALQIMEKRFSKEFDNWAGDRSKLVNLEKYSTAIFQAFDKLG